MHSFMYKISYKKLKQSLYTTYEHFENIWNLSAVWPCLMNRSGGGGGCSTRDGFWRPLRERRGATPSLVLRHGSLDRKSSAVQMCLSAALRWRHTLSASLSFFLVNARRRLQLGSGSRGVFLLISGWGQSHRWPPPVECRTLGSRRCWWTCRWPGPAPAVSAATPNAARRSEPPPRAAASWGDTSAGGKTKPRVWTADTEQTIIKGEFRLFFAFFPPSVWRNSGSCILALHQDDWQRLTTCPDPATWSRLRTFRLNQMVSDPSGIGYLFQSHSYDQGFIFQTNSPLEVCGSR